MDSSTTSSTIPYLPIASRATPSPANPCWYNSISYAVSVDGGHLETAGGEEGFALIEALPTQELGVISVLPDLKGGDHIGVNRGKWSLFWHRLVTGDIDTGAVMPQMSASF